MGIKVLPVDIVVNTLMARRIIDDYVNADFI